MKKKFEIKSVTFNKLEKGFQSKINSVKNRNLISNIKYSTNDVKNHTINTDSHINNSKCYSKPRPIYIISNMNKNHNLGINKYNLINAKKKFEKKKPKQFKNYEIKFNDVSHINYTKLNSERNQNNYERLKLYKNINKNEQISTRSNSYEFRPFNTTLNIREYFNYKYEQIKHNYKLDKLNIYNSSNRMKNYDNNEINKMNKTLDAIYRTKNLDKNQIKTIKEINNLNDKKLINKYKKNGMKKKSSKSTDIIKLCKILKFLDNNKNGTLIKEENDIGGKITLRKNSLERQILKNKYITNNRKIILIQKWWKDMLFKKYLEKPIIKIQKVYKGHKYRKYFLKYLSNLRKYNKPHILKKIILIQKKWKNYLTSINLNTISFSFTNNEDSGNLNLFNNNEINNGESSYLITDERKSNNNNYNILLCKGRINNCLITKKYYNNINEIISKIILIQQFFKAFLFKKHENNILIMNNKIYQKKNISNLNHNKSRNKEHASETIFKKENEEKYKYNSKSLIIISNKKELFELNYNTPKKVKRKTINFLKESPSLLNNSKINNKPNNTYKSDLLHKKCNKLYSFDRILKNVDMLNKITFLQKKIKKIMMKDKYLLSKNKIKVCYVDKQVKIVNNKLKEKIILIQKMIKKYFSLKKNINKNVNEKEKVIFSDNQYNLTNDISDEKKNNINSSNENNKNISEFSFNSNINSNINKYHILVRNNRKYKIETNFISENINSFSFDLNSDKESSNNKNIDKNNIGNENIEDDYNASNNKNIKDINNLLNFSSKNMLISTDRDDFVSKLRFLFVNNITYKLSSILIMTLNRLYLFDFIKILSQRINKNINQYIFQLIRMFSNNQKYSVEKNNESFYFSTLKRHINYNINNDKQNEVYILLKSNIPKCFNKINYEDGNFYRINIPYINKIQQNNLINTQLFFNDDCNLIKYFINFFIKEKINCVLTQTIIKNKLVKSKLKNRNLFTITKYMDNIYSDVINNKLCNICFCSNDQICNNIECICHIQNSKNIIQNNATSTNYNKMKIKQLLINKFKRNDSSIKRKYNNILNDMKDDINNEFFSGIDEEINSDENIDPNNYVKTTLNSKGNNSYSKDHNLSDLFPYNYNNKLNQSSYKFIDYINEKCKTDRFMETLPRTSRELLDSFRNKNI